MHYNYCPICGSKLIPKYAGDDGNIPFCETCNKFWFDSFSSCIIILVANEFDEIALLRQSYLSDKYASFVSGYMQPGETAEETAIREVEEEIGIKLDNVEYAGTYWYGVKDMLMHGYIGFTKKCELKLSEEVDSAEWVSAKEAPKYMFPETPGNAGHPIYRRYLTNIHRYKTF